MQRDLCRKVEIEWGASTRGRQNHSIAWERPVSRCHVGKQTKWIALRNRTDKWAHSTDKWSARHSQWPPQCLQRSTMPSLQQTVFE